MHEIVVIYGPIFESNFFYLFLFIPLNPSVTATGLVSFSSMYSRRSHSPPKIFELESRIQMLHRSEGMEAPFPFNEWAFHSVQLFQP